MTFDELKDLAHRMSWGGIALHADISESDSYRIRATVMIPAVAICDIPHKSLASMSMDDAADLMSGTHLKAVSLANKLSSKEDT